MTDLVVLSLEPWDDVWRRNQHLVAGLLRRDPGLRVLFVEPPVDPLHDVVTGHRPRRGHGVRPVALSGAEGRLWSFRPAKLLPRRLDSRVDARLAAATVRATRRVGFAAPVLWINDPSAAEVVRRTGWPALYDITDDWLEAERTPTEHARLVRDEALLMERCAEVVVCSTTLAAAKGRVRPVSLIPNAVDVAFYRRPQPRPADLPSGPVAVYVGTVHTDRMDLDLCVATARALGGAGTLVLVGPHPLADADLKRLRAEGVVLLGPRTAAAVPGYLQHADVLVVPHVVTPFTMSLDPIKRYEYAAVGRPVVSTPVTGFADADDPRVTVASGDAFAAAVRAAVPAASGFPPGVDEPVPDWAARVSEMRAVVERVAATSGAASRRPLKLVVDVLSAPSESGGMRSYADELIHAWFETPDGAVDELVVHGEPWVAQAFADLPRVRTVVVGNPNRYKRLTRQWFGTALLWRRERADAVLALGPVVTGLVPRSRRFCVVHDWRHVRRPEEFGRATRWYRSVWLPSIAGASAVVAISEKTCAETLDRVPRARVVTIPNGTDHPRRWALDGTGQAEPTIVTFGHHSNKRPGLVLEAFALLPADVRRGRRLLVLGARGREADALRDAARRLGVADSVDLPGFVPEGEYRRRVAGAALIVLASTDEGFGLPVVEANWFGTPVVATTDSGLTDIHGDRVIGAEPTPRALAEALAQGLAAPRRPHLGRRWADTASEIRGTIVRGVARGAR